MPGETDLNRLLRTLEPELDPGEYVFAAVSGRGIAQAICCFRESEGETVILPRQAAEDLGLSWTYPCKRITLRVHSSLEAIGLLARIASALADAGISINVVSAYYHDHLFVPSGSAGAAMQVLRELQANPAK